MRVYQNNRRAALRIELISLLGGSCAQCDVTENLQFDHIDPETKLFAIANGLDKPRAILLQEVAKCQLLCEPHHIEKSLIDGSHPRGEQMGSAKITPADVRDIRSSKLNRSELAETYGISKVQISAIRSRKAWKHID